MLSSIFAEKHKQLISLRTDWLFPCSQTFQTKHCIDNAAVMNQSSDAPKRKTRIYTVYILWKKKKKKRHSESISPTSYTYMLPLLSPFSHFPPTVVLYKLWLWACLHMCLFFHLFFFLIRGHRTVDIPRTSFCTQRLTMAPVTFSCCL